MSTRTRSINKKSSSAAAKGSRNTGAATLSATKKRKNVAAIKKRDKKSATTATKAAAKGAVYTGYMRVDEPQTEKLNAMYKMRTEMLRGILREENPTWNRVHVRETAYEKVLDEMHTYHPAPFGRQKGIYYTVNFETGEISYCASVWIAQRPGDYIPPADLRAQAKSRFDYRNRRITFNAEGISRDTPTQEVRELLVLSLRTRGGHAKTKTYKRFLNGIQTYK